MYIEVKKLSRVRVKYKKCTHILEESTLPKEERIAISKQTLNLRRRKDQP